MNSFIDQHLALREAAAHVIKDFIDEHGPLEVRHSGDLDPLPESFWVLVDGPYLVLHDSAHVMASTDVLCVIADSVIARP